MQEAYRGSRSRQAQAKTAKTLLEKYLKQKGLSVAQVVEHLRSKCKALSSNSNTANE
jgi:predicted NAD/FAD-binding protein